MGVMIQRAMKMMMMARYRPFFQEEVPAVEGVLIVLPLLGHGLAEGELGHAQHVDQVVLVIKGGVLPVLDLLEVLGQGHLGVEQTVFVDVLLVLDLLAGR